MTDIIGPSSSAPNVVTARPTDSRVFLADDSWFKDCTGSGGDGTKVQAGFLNGLLGMLRTAVRGMGISEATAADNLLREAIRAGMVRLAVSSGTADDLVVAFSPPFTAFGQMTFIVTAPTENTGGAMTLTSDDLATKALKYRDGLVPAGTFGPGRYVLVTYDGTAFQVVSGGNVSSPVLDFFTASGTWTRSAGRRWVFAIAHGPGGAGGGDPAGTLAAGGGGGPGGWAMGLYDISSLPSASVVIAAGGVGVVGNAGGDGAGNTSFGTLLVAGPGKGGRRGTSSVPVPGGEPGVGITGQILGRGSPGGAPTTTGYDTAGNGGSGLFGGGGIGQSDDVGLAASAGILGSGGGGADSGSGGGSASAGAAGGNGFVLAFQF